MKIREYKKEDFEEIFNLNKEISPDEDRDFVKEELGTLRGIVLVMEFSDKIIGFAKISFPFYNKCARVDSICINNQFRNKKYGTCLIEKIIEHAIIMEIRFITVDTALWNWKAINFYKKNGFVPISVFPNYYGDGNDMVWLQLDLRSINYVGQHSE